MLTDPAEEAPRDFFSMMNRMNLRIVLWLAVLPLLGSGCSRTETTPDDRAPLQLWESAREAGEAVWISPQARQALALEGVDLPEDDSDSIETSRDPSTWRRLDREQRYDAVLLAGEVATITPLLQHLRESPDFSVLTLDRWGVVFRREPTRQWSPPEPGEIRPDAAPDVRARELAGRAAVLLAMRENRAAQSYITAALALAPSDPLVLARRAAIDLQRGRLSEAVAEADRVLRIDPRNVAALQIKAQALARGGAADEAWKVSEELVRIADARDLVSLALHARLASEARAYSREQESLEQIVRTSERIGIEPVMYRVLLGQCYARQGLGRQAMEQFQKLRALESLPDSARTDVETAIERLSRAGF